MESKPQPDFLILCDGFVEQVEGKIDERHVNAEAPDHVHPPRAHLPLTNQPLIELFHQLQGIALALVCGQFKKAAGRVAGQQPESVASSVAVDS